MNEKRIEIIKWFINTVVIVLITLLIDYNFKDRETGIEEMKLYNQYVDVILNSDNIEERWRLVEYFSVVTPTERLRERWLSYQDVIREDYLKYQKLNSTKDELLSKPNINLDTLVVIQDKIKKVGGPLIKKDNHELATEYEKAGYDALLGKDISSAIQNFKLSEDSYNGYHSSYEIYLYLLRKKSQVMTDEEWHKIYNDIVTKYSWKMSEEYKYKFKNL